MTEPNKSLEVFSRVSLSCTIFIWPLQKCPTHPYPTHNVLIQLKNAFVSFEKDFSLAVVNCALITYVLLLNSVLL